MWFDPPNQLQVTDLTFVGTWRGAGEVCFVIDAYSRMIVGSRVAGLMKNESILDAIEMVQAPRFTRITLHSSVVAVGPGCWKTLEELERNAIGWAHWQGQ